DCRRCSSTRRFAAGAPVAGRGSRVCAGDEAWRKGIPGRTRTRESGAPGRVGSSEPGTIPFAGRPPGSGPSRTDRGFWPAASRRADLPGRNRLLCRMETLVGPGSGPGHDEEAFGAMGLLNLFTKSEPTLLRLPFGSFTVDRAGNVLTGTLP